ncbi:hypothetical protein Q0601_07570 [Paracoccus onubensis]|uniref:hypothetical protein n=1 Tax=Paracoccus onubensis TaxID=1675788 RepID=UPI00273200FC|nr:hypothetical protein [Paracoccus onubensis]MDP0927024.1 hypothetical protein [Paracoccus onubensis]
MTNLKFQLEKIKAPIYAYWQRKYYQAVEKQDFKAALYSLKKISSRYKGSLPPYWALELVNVRLSLGQFNRAVKVIEDIVASVNDNPNYSHDTKLFLLKHIEKPHSEALKGKYGIDGHVRVDGVRYVDIDEINFSKVDPTFRFGWPLDPI